MEPTRSSQVSCYRNDSFIGQKNRDLLNEKIIYLMKRPLVAKKELNTFLRENPNGLADFAIRRPVIWIEFSHSMRRHFKNRSKLFKLLIKLDQVISLKINHLYPRAVKQNIAKFYPVDLKNSAKSLIKVRQLLIGDCRYLKTLTQWIDYQKIPLMPLNLDLYELANVIPKLKFVDFSHYPKECIPYFVSKANEVSHLTCTWFEDEGLQNLTAFPYLLNLELPGCNITDRGVEKICDLSHLTGLNVSGCIKLTNTSIQSLSSLSTLTSLNISGCNQISSTGLKYLVKCFELKKLDVSCCNIGERALKIIGSFASLKILNLSCCEGIKDRGIEHLRTLGLLEEINLSFLKIGDLGVMYLTDLEALKVLNLKGCQMITDKAIQNLCHQSITSLGLKGCSNITDRAFKGLPTLSKVIKKLDLSGCYNITDEGLYMIAEFPELKHLSLKGCNGISNAGIFYLKRTKAIGLGTEAT